MPGMRRIPRELKRQRRRIWDKENRMKKRFLKWIYMAGCILLAAGNAAGCGAGQTAAAAGNGGGQTAAPETEPEEETAAERTVVFTDDLGRTVEVPYQPQRVAALIGSFADIWCLAGGEDSLAAAADDTWTQFDLGLSDEVKNLGAVKTPSTETLLASQPDFVLGSTKTAADVELLDMLDSMGIPGACFDVSSFDDYLRLLDICTQITGDEEAYETYGVKVQEQIDDARERAARARGGDAAPSVLYIRATGSSCKVKGSQGTVLGEMLADLGCVNVADSETALLEELSLETILAADPDYIFAVLQGADNSDAQAMLEGTLLSNPAWEGLTAVRQGRFHIMDQKLYNLKPNARWGEAYEKLADLLYPGEE